MDPQFLESLQSISASLKAIGKRLDSFGAPLVAIAQAAQKLDIVANSLLAINEQAETLIAASVSQSRRVEGLLADLIDVSAAPQVTHIARDRSGKVVSSTRSINPSSDA